MNTLERLVSLLSTSKYCYGVLETKWKNRYTWQGYGKL